MQTRLKTKGSFGFGRFQEIVEMVGADFVKQFTWKIPTEDYWTSDENLTADSEMFPRYKLVEISPTKLLEIAPHIQFNDTDFTAFNDGQQVFTLRAVDTSFWSLSSQDADITNFFNRKPLHLQ